MSLGATLEPPTSFAVTHAMSAQIFSIEVLTDGGAKLALNSKHDTHSGIRRVSCEISPDELLQLVVYAEALSLRQHLGHPASSSLSVDGLELSYDPATRDLHVVRQAGYSRQTARIPVEIFQTEMRARPRFAWPAPKRQNTLRSWRICWPNAPGQRSSTNASSKTRQTLYCISCVKLHFYCWSERPPPAGPL